MSLEKLYARYGELSVRQELLNGEIVKVKKDIADALNARKPEVVVNKEEVKKDADPKRTEDASVGKDTKE